MRAGSAPGKRRRRRPARRAAGLPALAVLLLGGLSLDGCAGRPPPAVPVPEPGPAWPELEAVGDTSGFTLDVSPGPAWPELASPEPLPVAPPAAPLLVRAGLAAGLPRAVVRCAGPALLLADGGATRLARLEAGEKATLVRAGRSVRWEAAGAHGEVAAAILQPMDPADAVAYGDARYRGELHAVTSRDGLTLINVLDLETYLRGVVPWEIGRVGPSAMAALEAQAVAARTYTLAHRNDHAELGFDVWADTRDQVYRGTAGEDSCCNAAIAATAGLILQHERRPIEAYYSAACGGRTAAVEEVWARPARPYLTSHRDAVAGEGVSFCSRAPRFRWQTSWSGERLERILQRTLPEYVEYMGAGGRAAWAGPAFTPRRPGGDPRRPGRLQGLRLHSRTSCGRVARLDIATDAGVYHVRGDRVRWVLPPDDGRTKLLWSALFRLDLERDAQGRLQRVVAHGRGYGHGVGLCQEGAVAMARRGFTCGQILAHYYPGAVLAPAATALPAAPSPGAPAAEGTR